MVLAEGAKFELAERLRAEGAAIGEIFSFVSGLYFRGKAEYARRFAGPPEGVAAALVITPDRGLVAPETVVTVEALREMARVPVEAGEARYMEPLRRDIGTLRAAAGPECAVVLLGSVATGKYVDPLVDEFGERLLFPAEFVGRGDMSRGGLLLRCARSGEELEYVPVAGAKRHGRRPARLPKLAR